MNAPPSPAAPPAADWASRYRAMLENRLRWTVESLPPAGQPPAELQPHLASLLTLLSEANQQLGPHPLSVQLTLGLHPWPLRWGMWPAWDSALRTAAQTAASLGLADQQTYLLTALAELQIARGVLPQALEFAVQALKIARTQHALPPFAAAASALLLTLRTQGENIDAVQHLNEFQSEVERWSPPPAPQELLEARARFNLHRAALLRIESRLTEALQAAHAALIALSSRPRQDPLFTEALQMRGTLYWTRGENHLAAQDFRRAAEILEQLGDSFEAVNVRGDLGLIHWSMAEYDTAEALIRQSVIACEQSDAQWRLVRSVGNLVAVQLSRGRLLDALEYDRRHIEIAQRIGDASELARAVGNRGSILLYLGRCAEALPDLLKTLAQFRNMGRQELVAVSCIELGLCYAGLKNPTLGLYYTQKAQSICESLKEQPALQIHWRRGMAFLHPPRVAVPWLEEALAVARETRRPLDEAACLLDLGGKQNTPEQALPYWLEAEKILIRIGAQNWLSGQTPIRPPFLMLAL